MHQQGPQESVDIFASQIQQFGSSIAAGSMPLDPWILSMVFMCGLDNCFDILERDFVLNVDKCVGLSLDTLQQEAIGFTSNLKNLMDEDVAPTGAQPGAHWLVNPTNLLLPLLHQTTSPSALRLTVLNPWLPLGNASAVATTRSTSVVFP